jgi:hypothetical protein
VNAGVNPTIGSYNASSVKMYNATSSLVRFENKNLFRYFKKRSIAYYLHRWRCRKNYKVVGSGPGEGTMVPHEVTEILAIFIKIRDTLEL